MTLRLMTACLLAILVSFAPAHQAAAQTARSHAWQPIDAANPAFTIDQAAVDKALFPISDADGNVKPNPNLLTAYMKVNVRTQPDPAGPWRIETWAFDCKGKYIPLETTDFNSEGTIVGYTAVDMHHADGDKGPRGIGLWGPEHFLVPVTNDDRAFKVQPIACAADRTSDAPAPVADIIERRWRPGRSEEAQGGWNDQQVIHGRLGADSVTLTLSLFAQPQGMDGPFGADSATNGIVVGMTAEFYRKLGLMPRVREPWGDKATCKMSISAPGLDTTTGFQSIEPLPSRAMIKAKTSEAASKLVARILEGGYDLTIACGDYPQPAVFHLTQPMPDRLKQEFRDNLQILSALKPHNLTQGL